MVSRCIWLADLDSAWLLTLSRNSLFDLIDVIPYIWTIYPLCSCKVGNTCIYHVKIMLKTRCSLLVDKKAQVIIKSSDAIFQIPKKVTSTMSDPQVKERLKRNSLSTRSELSEGMDDTSAKEKYSNVDQWWCEQGFWCTYHT